LPADDATELRCAGLLFARSRALASEERETLLAESRRSGRQAWLCLLGIPFGIGLIALMAAVLPKSENVLLALAGLGFLQITAGTAIFLRLALDRFGWSRGLRRDAAQDIVHVFEGVVPEGKALEPTLAALQKRGGLRPEGSRPRQLEVLPASSLVWKVDEVRPSSWIAALVARTARTPEAAAVAAQWVRPVAVPGGRVAMLNQRTLSPEEVLELRRLALRSLPGRILTALLVAYFAWSATMRLRAPDRDVFAFLIAGVAVFVGSRLVRDLQARWRFRGDARTGRVVIVQSAPVPGPDGEPTPGPTLEFLPVSNLPWTRDGKPLPWRTLNAFPAKELIPPVRRDAP
jgi:hypothetical protein